MKGAGLGQDQAGCHLSSHVTRGDTQCQNVLGVAALAQAEAVQGFPGCGCGSREAKGSFGGSEDARAVAVGGEQGCGWPWWHEAVMSPWAVALPASECHHSSDFMVWQLEGQVGAPDWDLIMELAGTVKSCQRQGEQCPWS